MAADAAAAPDEPERRPVELILSMLRAAPAATRGEIHGLLAAELAALPSAQELRLAELGFLASLLSEPPSTGCEFGTCERIYYDQRRPKHEPSSRQLVERYGSWPRACRAAYSLDTGGIRRGSSKPWPTTDRGKHREPFTRDEVLAAVRQCAEELRRAGLIGQPTSWQYDEWVRRSKFEAKRRGQEARLPYARAIYLRFAERPRGRSRWHTILRAALDDV